MGGIVVGSEFGNEVGRVLGGVQSERLGDGEKGVGEFSNGELLTGALGVSVCVRRGRGWVVWKKSSMTRDTS